MTTWIIRRIWSARSMHGTGLGRCCISRSAAKVGRRKLRDVSHASASFSADSAQPHPCTFTFFLSFSHASSTPPPAPHFAQARRRSELALKTSHLPPRPRPSAAPCWPIRRRSWSREHRASCGSRARASASSAALRSTSRASATFIGFKRADFTLGKPRIS